MGIDRTAHYCKWASHFVHTTEVALGCTHLSVHVQTSDVVVMAPRNRKLALLLAVAASAEPTLFKHSQCSNILFNKTILQDNNI